jgi:hypothetical protein
MQEMAFFAQLLWAHVQYKFPTTFLHASKWKQTSSLLQEKVTQSSFAKTIRLKMHLISLLVKTNFKHKSSRN